MKKNTFVRMIAIALIVMSVMVITIPAMADITDVNVTWTVVNVDHSGDTIPCIRSGMSAGSTCLVQLSGVSSVNVKADTGKIDWVRCKYGNYTGYIHCSYLSFTDSSFRNTFFNNYNLQQGFRGDPVKNLQLFLKKFGYYTIAVDNLFGSGTKSAVKNFQSAKGLTQDGIVGSLTSAKICEAYEMTLLPES